MIEEKKFDQRDVYANLVRIYHQIGRIYEPSSDIPTLCSIEKGVLILERQSFFLATFIKS